MGFAAESREFQIGKEGPLKKCSVESQPFRRRDVGGSQLSAYLPSARVRPGPSVRVQPPPYKARRGIKSSSSTSP